jgi:Aspartyl protease
MLSRTFRHCVLVTVWMVATLALSAQSGEHAVPMELRHNMPFVQVMVNGKGPFTFGIDTGTGGEALVSPGLIEQLQLPVTGEIEMGDPSGKNPMKAPVMGIDLLVVAGVEFKNVKAPRFQPSARDGQCDGILGFVLFRDWVLTMDYPGARLTLAAGAIKPDGGETVIPFSMPNDVPVIELRVGDRKVDAHVDSRGAGLSLPQKFATDLKFDSEPVVIGRGKTVSNTFEIKGALLNGDVRVAGYTFTHPFVAINGVLPMANFGAVPLHNFAVSFDQKNKLLKLVSAQKSLTIEAPQRRTAPAPVPQTAPAAP